MEVTVTRNIENGTKWCISPSYGWLGIEDGTVVVEAVGPYEFLIEMEEAKDCADPEVIIECDPDAINQPWVIYKYQVATWETEGFYMIPLDLFAQHISWPA